MKASLKFREEKKPTIKAKIPLNILNLPFQSTLLAGDSKELCLSLGTYFESGPSFRFSYRPNDAFNPFSFIIKSGIGHFGSPIDAPMTMSAQFNFPNSNSTPAFFLHFKPNFGDFSLKKSQQSSISYIRRNDGVLEEEDESIEVVEREEFFSKERITNLPLRSSVEEAVSGMELGAKTVLPVTNGAVLKLRWGVKFPQGFQNLFNNKKSTAGISPRRIPFLSLNKISIEHVAVKEKAVVGPVHGTNDDGVVENCFSVKRQVETLRSENYALGKALEDLRAEFGGSKGRGGGRERILVPEFEGVSVDDVTKN